MKITHAGKLHEFYQPSKSVVIKQVDHEVFEVWHQGKRPRLIATEESYVAAEAVLIRHVTRLLLKEVAFLSAKAMIAGRRKRLF